MVVAEIGTMRQVIWKIITQQIWSTFPKSSSITEKSKNHCCTAWWMVDSWYKLICPFGIGETDIFHGELDLFPCENEIWSERNSNGHVSSNNDFKPLRQMCHLRRVSDRTGSQMGPTNHSHQSSNIPRFVEVSHLTIYYQPYINHISTMYQSSMFIGFSMK